MAARTADGDCHERPKPYTVLQADVQRRLDALEQNQGEQSRDIYEARKTPWAIIISAIGVLLIILGMFGKDISGWITSEVHPVKEFAQYNFAAIEKSFDLTRQERQEVKARINDDIALLRSEVNQLRSTVYPLEVHRQRWEHYDLTIKAIEDRIRETNARIADLYSPADKFKEIQEQLDQMRDLVDRKFMNGGPPMYLPPPSPPTISPVN